jgi:crotonobetainyl-CoA:carnitine CoA-transferase CaiB-like acyl-CoA transferase
MRKNFPDGLLGRLELVALCEAGPGPHQQPLIDFLGEVFAKKTQAQWVEWFAGRDISFAPVKDLREALADPQLVARGMVLRDERGHLHLGIPIKLSDEPGVPSCTRGMQSHFSTI